MDNMAVQTKRLAQKLEKLKQKAKIQKDMGVLLEKTKELRDMKLENKRIRGTMKAKKIRI